MMKTLRNLRYLWKTRKTSGFPWPSYRTGIGSGWHLILTGYPSWVAIPLWRQIISIPMRPYRYWRKVKAIARTRATFYNHQMNDDVS